MAAVHYYTVDQLQMNQLAKRKAEKEVYLNLCNPMINKKY